MGGGFRRKIAPGLAIICQKFDYLAEVKQAIIPTFVLGTVAFSSPAFGWVSSTQVLHFTQSSTDILSEGSAGRNNFTLPLASDERSHQPMIHLANSGSCGSSQAKALLNEINNLKNHADWPKQRDWIVARVENRIGQLAGLGCTYGGSSTGSGGTSGGGGTTTAGGSCGSGQAKDLLRKIDVLTSRPDWSNQAPWMVRNYNGFVADLAALGCSVKGGGSGGSSGGGSNTGQGGGGTTTAGGSCGSSEAKDLLRRIDVLTSRPDWPSQAAWMVRNYNGFVADLSALGCNVEGGGSAGSSGGGGNNGGGSGTTTTSGSCNSGNAKALINEIENLKNHPDWAKQKTWIINRVNDRTGKLANLGCTYGSDTAGSGGSSGGGGTTGGSGGGGGSPPVDASGAVANGVHTGGATPAAVAGFQSLTGQKSTYWKTFFGSKAGWKVIENGRVELINFRDYQKGREPFQLVISYAPFPATEGKGKTPLQKCAAGSYNSHYKKFGQKLNSVGLPDIVLRIGWEWNLGSSSMPWGTGGDLGLANLFANCFRQVVKTIRAAYPGNKLLFDWTATQSASSALLNAGWPGSQYVDYVGVDAYDRNFGACNQKDFPCRWSKTVVHLKRFLNFAKGKGKPMTVPEWGVWSGASGDTSGGGDNPYYIEQMGKFFKDNKNHIAYHLYFNVNATADHRLNQHPKALAAYRKVFGGG